LLPALPSVPESATNVDAVEGKLVPGDADNHRPSVELHPPSEEFATNEHNAEPSTSFASDEVVEFNTPDIPEDIPSSRASSLLGSTEGKCRTGLDAAYI
jgi:hypothetical protein